MPSVRFVAATAALVLCARPATAQLSVAGTRDLDFGAVLVGITTTVVPTDPVQSGQWTVTASRGNQIQIRMTLPNALIGPSGATLPVSFRNGDAFVQGTWTGSVARSFNPNGAAVFRFTAGTQALIRLGGSATPAADQPAGAYANTATITVILLN